MEQKKAKIERELSGVITDVEIKTNSITDREEIQPRDGSDEFYTQLPYWDLGWNDDLKIGVFHPHALQVDFSEETGQWAAVSNSSLYRDREEFN